MRKSLVIFQFVASAILIISSVVVYQQMNLVRHKDLGFDQDHILVVKIFGPNMQYNTIKQQFLQHPNIISASASLDLPGHSWPSRRYVSLPQTPNQEFEVRVFHAKEDFFSCYGIPILAGTSFTQAYAENTAENANTMQILINRTAARQFNLLDPIGQTLIIQGKLAKIIGLVQDFHVRSLREPLGPVIISATGDRLKYLHLKVRPENIHETMAFVEDKCAELRPSHPTERFFIDDYIESKYRREQRQETLFAYSAIVSILLACLGLAGLSAYSAQQRTLELSIRKVLGASSHQLVKMIIRDFGKLIITAGLIACPIGYYLMQNWLQNFAYQTNLSAWPFVLSIGIPLMVALLTAGYFAWKTVRINPADVLRNE